jgi:hypothetical protein
MAFMPCGGKKAPFQAKRRFKASKNSAIFSIRQRQSRRSPPSKDERAR